MNKITEMYVRAQNRVQSVLKDEKGATMVEYAMMVALIAAVCVTIVGTLGDKAVNAFKTVSDAMP